MYMTTHVGRRGSGKTYHMTKCLLRAHRAHSLVITNYTTTFSDIVVNGVDEINAILKELRQMKESGFEPVDFNPKLKSSLIYLGIDECHLIWTSDFWKENRADRTLLSIMAEARKMGIIIHLTTQSIQKLDADLRKYCDPYVFYDPIFPIRIPRRRKRLTASGNTTIDTESRFLLPLFRREEHEFKEGQVFRDEQSLSTKSITTAGWLSPRTYRLYNHNELVMHRTKPNTGTLFPYLSTLQNANKEKIPTGVHVQTDAEPLLSV